MPEPAPLRIRPADVAVLGFLEQMLFEVFFWDPAAERPALRLFESVGFRRVGASGTSLTLRLDLGG